MTAGANARHGLEDFHLGAPVYSRDGRHVGSLHRLVIEAESWEPRQIIVQESGRFSGHQLGGGARLLTDDIIVPLEDVANVARGRVDLALDAADVRRLPPYLSYHYAPLERRDLTNIAVRVLSSGFGGLPGPRLTEEADKRTEDIEIRPGENVMLGHDGQKLGHVHDVLFDDGELVGVVVHPEGLLTQDVVIQVRFLERGDDAALFVRMREEDLAHLQRFESER